MRSLIILALVLAAATAAPRNPQRIIGGSVTSISQYPSIAALLYSSSGTNFKQDCGGTIINTNSILTAAHCTIGDSPNQWRVRVGSSYASTDGVEHSVSQVINHASYNPWTFNNDIGILRLTIPITYTNSANAGFFASSNYNLGDNQVVWAAGWGATELGGGSEQLRHVQIWTVNQQICANNYASLGMTITNNMLCAGWLGVGGRDQCWGDSGGPLYHNNVVVGVCSFGYQCALADYPGVNARVSSFASWIAANA